MNRSYQMPERPWPGYYLTAYGLAVKNGFVGSEQEWLESLKGETGPQGVSPTVTVTKAGGVTTVTITDATGEHTATIKDGEVTREALDAALAAKQDTMTPISTEDIDSIWEEAGEDE